MENILIRPKFLKSKLNDLFKFSVSEVMKIEEELGLNKQTVVVYDCGRTRYWYGFSGLNASSFIQNSPGFIKKSKSPKLNDNLEREACVSKLADKLNLPTVKLLHFIKNTNDGLAILHLEKLDTEQGMLFNKTELINTINPQELGKRIASLVVRLYKVKIPTDLDSMILERNLKKNSSIASFLDLHRMNMDHIYTQKQILHKIWPKQNQIVKIFRLMKKNIANSQVYLAESESNHEYLVHNDLDLSNIFLSKKLKADRLLDFEFAGAVHNPDLGFITDLANLYTRCWPNQFLQQSILINIFKILISQEPKSLDRIFSYCKTAIYFGTTSLAKYGTNSKQYESEMIHSLLSSLEANLGKLEQEYLSLK